MRNSGDALQTTIFKPLFPAAAAAAANSGRVAERKTRIFQAT
jgi:hypothetical protein